MTSYKLIFMFDGCELAVMVVEGQFKLNLMAESDRGKGKKFNRFFD